jgi:purine-binding chemotaxis protein CheW
MNENELNTKGAKCQLCTFEVADRVYGIDVMRVQEVTRALPMAKIPLAPNYIHGLINLRGQISTAVGLRELFSIPQPQSTEGMNVVCKLDDVLVSFLVDKIGDVIELDEKDFESTPETVPENIRKFLEGVYKIPGHLVSVIDIDRLTEYFFKHNQHSVRDREKQTAEI